MNKIGKRIGRIVAFCFLFSALSLEGASVISGSTKTYVNKPVGYSFDAAQLKYHWTWDGAYTHWTSSATFRTYPSVTNGVLGVAPGAYNDSRNGVMGYNGNQSQSAFRTPGLFGQAYWCDAQNGMGWVTNVDLRTVSVMTISLWMFVTNIASWNSDRMLIEGGTANWTDQTNSILIDTGNGFRQFTLGIRDSADITKSRADVFTNTVYFNMTNKWCHVAFIFDNSTSTGRTAAYVNGSPATMFNSVNTKASTGNFGNHQWGIGGRPSASLILNCKLDDLRIYSGELTQAQVSEIVTNSTSKINTQ